MGTHDRFPLLDVAVWIMAGSRVTEAQAASSRGDGNSGRLLTGRDLRIGQKVGTGGIVRGRHGELTSGRSRE